MIADMTYLAGDLEAEEGILDIEDHGFLHQWIGKAHAEARSNCKDL